MKRKLLLVALLFGSGIYAQTDTSKVEQYCEMVAEGRFMSKKVNIDIDFGEQRKFFGKDTRLKDDEGNIKKFNGVVDALNYLGQQGWKLVNAYPITVGGALVYHFVFKREVSKNEMVQ